jgi:hypothetical protein
VPALAVVPALAYGLAAVLVAGGPKSRGYRLYGRLVLALCAWIGYQIVMYGGVGPVMGWQWRPTAEQRRQPPSGWRTVGEVMSALPLAMVYAMVTAQSAARWPWFGMALYALWGLLAAMQLASIVSSGRPVALWAAQSGWEWVG